MSRGKNSKTFGSEVCGVVFCHEDTKTHECCLMSNVVT